MHKNFSPCPIHRHPSNLDRLIRIWALLVSGLFLPCFLLTSPSIAKGKYLPASQWTGEYLQTNESAAFIRLQLQDFQRSSRGRFITGNVIIQLKNMSNQQSYQLSQSTQSQGQPQFIWKLPQAIYKVEQVSLIDHEGRNRIWLGPSQVSFRADALNLSYFGSWVLKPGEGNQLIVEFKIDEPNYQHQFPHQTFAFVIHGISGQKLQELGGNALIQQSKDNFSTNREARATFSTVRQISMVYQLNLGRFHQQSQNMIRTLNNQDLELRTCYSDQLELDESLTGSVRFRFLISKTDGVMDRIVYKGGSLKNENVARCLYYKLGQMQFPISTKLQGQITFQFSIK